ncbi:uncharacterized protein LOC141723473 [Apium graveolens]|uniref:uncharacterized protein LOC141723473 n=1 Tax=Apium graveolens TaxID=4045 RepID=UPI003D79C78A
MNMEDDKEVSSFKELGVCEQLVEACDNLGWKTPSKIQALVLPHALEGKDLIGLAQTGSGKTGAFAIPILQSLLENPQAFYACVLSPTRELAIQIAEQFEALGSGIGVKCTVLVGGVDQVQQSISLGKRPHIIVATPGSLVDHLSNTKGFSLRTLKYLLRRNMKPIRTRVVKKRVKPRDPLIPKVLIPIQEESFELPEQMSCSGYSASSERTVTGPTSPIIPPVSEYMFPPLPPPPPLPQEPVPPVQGIVHDPIEMFDPFEFFEPMVPLPVEHQFIPGIEQELPPPPLLPPIPVHAAEPDVFQMIPVEGMGEHDVDLQLGLSQPGAGIPRVPSQESVSQVAQPYMVPYHEYRVMRDDVEYWRAQCRGIMHLFDQRDRRTLAALQPDYYMRQRLQSVLMNATWELDDLTHDGPPSFAEFYRIFRLAHTLVQTLREELRRILPGL